MTVTSQYPDLPELWEHVLQFVSILGSAPDSGLDRSFPRPGPAAGCQNAEHSRGSCGKHHPGNYKCKHNSEQCRNKLKPKQTSKSVFHTPTDNWCLTDIINHTTCYFTTSHRMSCKFYCHIYYFIIYW